MSRKKKEEDFDASRGLAAILYRFEIRTWDLLLVGDGSGGSWNIGCGWSVVLIDRRSMKRKHLFGAWNSGTVGVGELMPYLHALMWFDAVLGDSRKAARTDALEVHVISDNETVVKQGNGEMKRKANAPLWASIEQICRGGYQIRWHWAERDTTSLNSFADNVSRKARVSLQELEADLVLKGECIYRVNPF